MKFSVNISARNERGQMIGMKPDQMPAEVREVLVKAAALLVEAELKMARAAAAEAHRQMVVEAYRAAEKRPRGRPPGYKVRPETIAKMVETKSAVKARNAMPLFYSEGFSGD